MKVYITKYALTHGIEEKEAERCTSVNPDMIEITGNKYDEFYHGEGIEWHLTKESAISKAKEMRDKKIESLKKQIAKLENKKFN